MLSEKFNFCKQDRFECSLIQVSVPENGRQRVNLNYPYPPVYTHRLEHRQKSKRNQQSLSNVSFQVHSH